MTKPKLPIPGDLLKSVASAKPAEGTETSKASAKPGLPDPRGGQMKTNTKAAGKAGGAGQMRSSNRGK